YYLYAFCRRIDDAIDEAPDAEEAKDRLRQLRLWVHRASTDTDVSDLPVEFRGLQILFQEYALPLKYPLDLLTGMQMDVDQRVYESFEDLKQYCYCVAGVVGLMMCHVLGISSHQALKHAVALGNAMQMTNICRDVLTDWKLGRIYFPRAWLKECGLSPQNFAQPENRVLWVLLSRRLLAEADLFYTEGRRGLGYLPWQGAWAIAVASRLYQSIGHLVRSRGSLAWDQRLYTSWFHKFLIAFRETGRFFTRIRDRGSQPWAPIQITRVWEEA
ncbi:MAG: phytoene/squalene synthase family protein, partial [Bdellovibrio sp.]